jgi:hypothetical protein
LRERENYKALILMGGRTSRTVSVVPRRDTHTLKRDTHTLRRDTHTLIES